MNSLVSHALEAEVEPVEPLAACAHILHETAALLSMLDRWAERDPPEQKLADEAARLLIPAVKSAYGAIRYLHDDPLNSASLDGPKLAVEVREAMSLYMYDPDWEVGEPRLRAVHLSPLVRNVGGVNGALGPGGHSPEDAQAAFVGVIAACAAILDRC